MPEIERSEPYVMDEAVPKVIRPPFPRGVRSFVDEEISQREQFSRTVSGDGMLSKITPVILTYNEEVNIFRVLERLEWAEDIVVVDSFSTDDTIEIVEQFDNVRLFKRKFDSHANQWNYAIQETQINTDWVLALDADYVLTDEFVGELESLSPEGGVAGFSASFIYCVFGRPLKGALYPPVTVLFKRNGAIYKEDGHTQRVRVPGEVVGLSARIRHDDRKSLAHWLRAQDRYMDLEAKVITSSTFSELGMNDRIRKMIVIAPFLVLIYCLIIKKGILDGWAGVYYAFQRLLAETVLSLKLIEHRLRNHRIDG